MAEEFISKMIFALEGAGEAAKTLEEVKSVNQEAAKAAEKEDAVEEKKSKKSVADAVGERLNRESANDSKLAQQFSGSLQKLSRNQFLAGVGGVVSTGSAISGSGLAGSAANTGLTQLLPAAAGAAGGPLVGAITQAMTQVGNKFIQDYFNRKAQVEREAGAAVSGQAKGYFERGIELGDGEIAEALNREREIARRRQEGQRQINRVQDLTNDSIEGSFSYYGRRALDALIG